MHLVCDRFFQQAAELLLPIFDYYFNGNYLDMFRPITRGFAYLPWEDGQFVRTNHYGFHVYSIVILQKLKLKYLAEYSH